MGAGGSARRPGSSDSCLLVVLDICPWRWPPNVCELELGPVPLGVESDSRHSGSGRDPGGGQRWWPTCRFLVTRGHGFAHDRFFFLPVA